MLDKLSLNSTSDLVIWSDAGTHYRPLFLKNVDAMFPTTLAQRRGVLSFDPFDFDLFDWIGLG